MSVDMLETRVEENNKIVWGRNQKHTCELNIIGVFLVVAIAIILNDQVMLVKV